MQSRIVFIIPYFGQFNNYFQLFLDSCAKNAEITWLIFTDDKRNFRYPDNVKVEYCKFADIQKRIRTKFSFNVSIDRPYKLCDYKVAYGYLFEEYLSEYDFWGYCDTDIIWGSISKFITNDILDHYDKIGIYGHCTIFRNSSAINEMFMAPLNGKSVYKTVFLKKTNCSFDEEFNGSINNIFIENGVRIYDGLLLANIYMKSSNFRLIYMNKDRLYEVEKNKKAFFVWDSGKLMRYEKCRNKIEKTDYLYIHMQSREMKVKIQKSTEKYKIIPNSFENIEKYPITIDNFKEIKIKHVNLHYFKLRFKNLCIKLHRRIGYRT